MAAILVVDDDDTIREGLCELFESEHLCHSAGTVQEALTQLAAQDYDVVITDLSMPGMSGEDLMRFVRTYQPSTPVIFISGAIDRLQAQNLIIKGAFSYLMKPFRLEDIEASVNRAIAHRQRLLEARRNTSFRA